MEQEHRVPVVCGCPALEMPSQSVVEPIITLQALAERWGYEMASLRNIKLRRKLGLPVIRVGGRYVGTYERDVMAIEAAGLEY